MVIFYLPSDRAETFFKSSARRPESCVSKRRPVRSRVNRRNGFPVRFPTAARFRAVSSPGPGLLCDLRLLRVASGRSLMS